MVTYFSCTVGEKRKGIQADKEPEEDGVYDSRAGNEDDCIHHIQVPW